ncbi:restriction endonuclease subunit S [Aeromonas caviae]|uniref:restriction endonuclease subunit S n=1 Tax=Aeromonas caviae TaxID=648 RepID=UPI002253943F|nr:restriction endonuclease subunit S [Aeromonas caviae]MCX4030942.1 restriction endonuclease subunit S [Aeromonas caviae]
MAIENLIDDHLDLWTSAVRPKSSAGRGSNSKLELTGIKKLRELILALAVRGKLVPQDPNDEPASVLLARIAADKARLVKAGKIKKEKQYSAITKTELPSHMPNGWVFERFGNVLINRDFERIPLAVSDREKRKGPYDYYGASGVIDHIDGYLFDKPLLLIGEDGANLINRSTPIAFMARGKYWVNNHAHVLDGLNEELLLYVCLHINAISLEPYITGTAQPKMNQAKMNEIILGIPPASEQHRIVAKVDELMALCDQLEQHSESQLAAHQTLVETLLATLTDSSDADELAQNWERLSTHFDTLFTTEASIDALKQTILQLAVMGKLVPQDPADEPASVLLERIATEKAQLVKEGKIKKEKPLPTISEEEKPFELPAGWEWCRLNDLALSSEAGWSPQCESTPRENNKWGVLKVSAVTWGVFKPEENKELPESLEPRPEYEVKPGDFLISRANTAELVARAVIVSDDAPTNLMMSDKIIRFKFSKLISAHFINMVNNSMFSRLYYAKVAGGTSSSMRNVSRGQIQNLVIALPPISEALQIIDRTNELMVICDTLKTRLQTNQQTKLALAEALVEGALA